jgi:hypothetical protein
MNGLKNVVFFRLEEKTVWNANKLIDMLREVGCTTTVLDTKDLEDYWKLCKHFEADFIRNNKMSVGRNEFKEWFERN